MAWAMPGNCPDRQTDTITLIYKMPCPIMNCPTLVCNDVGWLPSLGGLEL